MLTVLLQTITGGVAMLLAMLVNIFMNALEIELSGYLEYFPLLGTFYTILQGFAIGMILLIAGNQLRKFWFGSIDANSMTDRPAAILLRSFAAVGAVYMGGYILSMLAELAKIPFRAFLETSALETNYSSIREIIVNGAATMLNPVASGMFEVVSGLDTASAILSAVLSVLIAWNTIKLMLEVCERYLMVGVLTFTSPIFYPMLATKESSQIFKKWFQMFIGALVMMSVSVMFLKLIVNGLFNSTLTWNYLFRNFLVLAMCKIAQRADSYLQQLGLNVATTGGSMVDDLMALASSARKLGGGGGSSGTGGGLIVGRTALGRGFKGAVDKFSNGGSIKESFAAGRHAAQAERYSGGAAYKTARKNGASQKEAIKEGLTAQGRAATLAIAPAAMAKRDGALSVAGRQKAQEERDKVSNAAKAAEAKPVASHNPMPPDKLAAATAKADQYDDKKDQTQATDEQNKKQADYKLGNAKDNYQNYGMTNDNGQVLALGENGDAKLTPEAAAAGMSMNDDGAVSFDHQSAASEYMANAMQQDDGKVNLGSSDDYAEAAAASHQQKFEKAYAPADLRKEAAAADAEVGKLRKEEAGQQEIAAAEARAAKAHETMQAATVAAGEAALDQAKATVETLKSALPNDQNNLDYKDATAKVDSIEKDLAFYKASIQSNDPNMKVSTQQADRLANEAKAAYEAYDTTAAKSNEQLRNFIAATDVNTAAQSLLRPDYTPANNETTQMVATKVFRDTVTDMPQDASFVDVVMHQDSNGGRSFQMSYVNDKGETKSRTVYDAASAAQLPDDYAKNLKVFTSADGRHWLTDADRHVDLAPKGTQFNEPSVVKDWFAKFRQKWL